MRDRCAPPRMRFGLEPMHMRYSKKTEINVDTNDTHAFRSEVVTVSLKVRPKRVSDEHSLHQESVANKRLLSTTNCGYDFIRHARVRFCEIDHKHYPYNEPDHNWVGN